MHLSLSWHILSGVGICVKQYTLSEDRLEVAIWRTLPNNLPGGSGVTVRGSESGGVPTSVFVYCLWPLVLSQIRHTDIYA
jgi:hypothetical protein